VASVLTSRILPGLFLIFAVAFPSFGNPTLVFSPSEWKFGSILKGEKIQTVVTVKNTGEFEVAVGLLPTCTCNTATPSERIIKAGGEGSFVIAYDSSDDTGITRKDFIIRTQPPGVAPPYYTSTGIVRSERRWGTGQGSQSAASGPGSVSGPAIEVTVAYYYTPGCRTCEEFLSTEIPRLSRELGVSINVERKDVLQPAVYGELAAIASSRGEIVRELPALAVGNTLLQGDGNIRKNVAAALKTQFARSPAPAALSLQAEAAAALFSGRLAAFPIALAGLIDGVNPCAFTTLIFLLASLALAGRGRREVLLIGSLFTLSVFITYLGIGYGLFTVLRAASTVSIVSLVIRWVLVIVLAVFAGLSVYDYTLIRQGRPTQMLLQLPSALKRQIHASIRTRVRAAALVGSSLVLGFLVSLFEFACTGQVYLPMLAYLVRMRGGTVALGLLLLYNLCFIVPLLIVFGASYLGVSSGRITTWFQTHMGKVKLGLAAVFTALAVFTLVG
jgi:cytochrome c biogenesis protein CcdA